jgi:HEAT repeat protein
MERLERDRKSDDPLVRYYAVIAMTKLDPRWFADSLRSAALDEDATVRGVAIRALQRA